MCISVTINHSVPRNFAMLGFLLALSLVALAQEVSVSAPESIPMYSLFDVSWSGPAAQGDTIEVRESGGNRVPTSYVYVDAHKNPVHVRAPEHPGDYTLVYVSEREVLASREIAVTAVTASLTGPDSVDANSMFDIAWTGPDNGGDWIGVAKADGSKLPGGTYAYTGNAKGGPVQLRAPAESGSYSVIYVTAKTTIGSIPLRVGSVDAKLEAPETVATGAPFEVRWIGPNDPGDLLVIARSDGSKLPGASYAYTGNSPEKARLIAPEATGSYLVQYVAGQSVIGSAAFEVTAVNTSLSAPDEVVAGSRFDVVWEGPGNPGDWIEVHADGAARATVYDYIGNGDGNRLAITAPDEGDYLLRYLTPSKRVLATRALRIVPAPVKPGQLLVLASPARHIDAATTIEVVLDASGSMLKQQNGSPRIEIAKRTLHSLVTDTIPEGTHFAMRVFGHKEAGSCRTDLEIPLTPLQASAAQNNLAGIQAMNLAKTPIARSLELTERDLGGVTGERVIILVTDGKETCEGDPAAVIAAMRTRGIDVRVNIVGYAIDDEKLRDTFARWALLGGGEYLNAEDETDLAAALTRSVTPRFSLINAEGTEVSRGIAGGEPLSLAPGSYEIRYAGRSTSAQVESQKVTEVTLE